MKEIALQDIREYPWFKHKETVYLYIYLLLNCDENGELIKSRSELKKETEMTDRIVRDALDRLKQKMIETKIVQKKTKITILNFKQIKGRTSRKKTKERPAETKEKIQRIFDKEVQIDGQTYKVSDHYFDQFNNAIDEGYKRFICTLFGGNLMDKPLYHVVAMEIQFNEKIWIKMIQRNFGGKLDKFARDLIKRKVEDMDEYLQKPGMFNKYKSLPGTLNNWIRMEIDRYGRR